MIRPKNQQEPIDIRMPKGTAFVALAASSLVLLAQRFSEFVDVKIALETEFHTSCEHMNRRPL